MAEELSVDKIGKVWQNLGWMNGWSNDGIEHQIYEEAHRRGYKFKETSHDIHGYCTTYESEEAMVSYMIDSSD